MKGSRDVCFHVQFFLQIWKLYLHAELVRNSTGLIRSDTKNPPDLQQPAHISHFRDLCRLMITC